MFDDVDFLAALRDKKTEVNINQSAEKYLIQHFSLDRETNLGTIIVTCGSALALYKYDEDLEITVKS